MDDNNNNKVSHGKYIEIAGSILILISFFSSWVTMYGGRHTVLKGNYGDYSLAGVAAVFCNKETFPIALILYALPILAVGHIIQKCYSKLPIMSVIVITYTLFIIIASLILSNVVPNMFCELHHGAFFAVLGVITIVFGMRTSRKQVRK